MARWRSGTTRTPRSGRYGWSVSTVGDYETEWTAMRVIAGQLGMSPETLRRWVRQAQVDDGEMAGVSSEEKRELRDLLRKGIVRQTAASRLWSRFASA
jgi:transposase-like protein